MFATIAQHNDYNMNDKPKTRTYHCVAWQHIGFRDAPISKLANFLITDILVISYSNH